MQFIAVYNYFRGMTSHKTFVRLQRVHLVTEMQVIIRLKEEFRGTVIRGNNFRNF